MVRAVVSFEGSGAPLVAEGGGARGGGAGGNQPAPLSNLHGIPTMYLTAENSGRTQGPAIVQALRQAGAQAEHIHLGDRSIRGNGHFAMLETNRKEVFEVIRGWIESKLPATSA